jgi:choline dehydrogenase-like flavoprotein
MQADFLEKLDRDHQLKADICLIGSGPAALTIAQELGDANIRIIIVESGGLTEDFSRPPDDNFVNSGEPRIEDLRLVRNRVFGGTSHSWSGRCAMFDPIDFERRPWLPMSGWPIDLQDLSPFRARADRYIGIEDYVSEATFKTLGERSSEFPDRNSQLSTFFWTFSRDASDNFDHMRFGPAFLKRDHNNIRILLHAAATHIDTSDIDGSVVGLEVSDRSGQRFKVEAPLIVVCCGGIENARLLLTSNRKIPSGLGNKHDLVGRYLMDHPRAIIAEFDPVAAATLRDSYSFVRLASGAVVAAGFSLSAETQRREQLLNCASWLDEEHAADDPWHALKRLRRRASRHQKISDTRAVLANPSLVMRGIWRRVIQKRGVSHKVNRIFMRSIVEQAPDPSSRINLSNQLDQYGVPLPRIDWRIGQLERKSISRLAELIEQELPRLGFAKPKLIANPEFIDAAHPSGTTRMADGPADGVVNKDCEVYGTRGLFVAGSSVFPTASHANPTLMIVILAIRLAEKLRREVAKLTAPQHLQTG